MQVERAVYDALQSANVPSDKAKAVAAAITQAIDQRYELYAKLLATRGDLQEVKADLTKAILESQRWTIAAVGIIVALVAAIQKLL